MGKKRIYRKTQHCNVGTALKTTQINHLTLIMTPLLWFFSAFWSPLSCSTNRGLKTEHSRSQCNIPRGWFLITTYSTMGSSFFFRTDLAVSANWQRHTLRRFRGCQALGVGPLYASPGSVSQWQPQGCSSVRAATDPRERREASFPRGRQLQNTPGPSLDSERPGTKASHLRYQQSLSHHPVMGLLHVYRGFWTRVVKWQRERQELRAHNLRRRNEREKEATGNWLIARFPPNPSPLLSSLRMCSPLNCLN